MIAAVDRFFYAVSGFAALHHRLVLTVELICSAIALILEIFGTQLGLADWSSSLKIALLAMLTMILGGEIYLARRASDPSHSMPGAGPLKAKTMAEVLNLVLQPLESSEYELVQRPEDRLVFSRLHQELIQSHRRPSFLGGNATPADQIHAIFTWHRLQPTSLMLLKPPPVENRRWLRFSPQVSGRQQGEPSGICAVLGVSAEVAAKYKNGEVVAYNLADGELQDPRSAPYALLISVALKPGVTTSLGFVGRAAFSHLRLCGLLRQGVEVLAPAADPRRRAWLETLGFVKSGHTRSGRDVYGLVIREEFLL